MEEMLGNRGLELSFRFIKYYSLLSLLVFV